MRVKHGLILAAALLIAAFLQCSGDGGSPSGGSGGGDPSLATNIQPVFSASCATSSSCHAAPGQQGLILSTGQSYAHLVNVVSAELPVLWRVRPGVVDSSYVVNKIEGTQTVGARMPPGGSPLSSSTIQTIKTWITKGAQNN